MKISWFQFSQNLINLISKAVYVHTKGGRVYVEVIGSAPTMVCICGKSPNSDFFDQTGPKKVRIYLKKSAFLNFPSILNLRIRRSSLNIAPMTIFQKTDPT